MALGFKSPEIDRLTSEATGLMGESPVGALRKVPKADSLP